MHQPLVTIGLPVYNSGEFLVRSIKSILEQTYENFELIITDDGSTDNSHNIIRSFKDQRIIYIPDYKNKGISFRLNQQIEMAKGEYFCRMDSDDIMLPWRLQEQVNFLINNPQVDIIGSGAYVIDDNDKIIGQRSGTTPYQVTLKKLYSGVAFIHPTVMGKTKIFRHLKYNEMLKGVEDMDLWYRAASESVVMEFFPLPVICYREPLKMKLNTYLFRQIQTRQFWGQSFVKELFGKWGCRKSIIKSYLKSAVAIMCCLTNNDSKLMARRNRQVNLSASGLMTVTNYIDKLNNSR